ncbi:MAG TPA: glycosylase [Blastocatellia bacterium]|nr:glycosylase [Blastocatellia bacterium]
MFKWRKLGKVFDPTERNYAWWMREFAQAPATLVFDDFVRVYFSCRPEPDSHGQYVSYSGFIDLDRSDLFNVLRVSDSPILPLGKLGMFDEFGTYPVSVIRDGGRILAYYGGWTRCESVPFNVAIGAAESDDGESFTKLGPGPIIPYSLHEPFVISGPKIRRFNDTFHLFYISGREWILDAGKPEPVYKIRSARSYDGIKWTKTGLDLISDSIAQDEAQASPDVFYREGMYHMFFCFRHGTRYRGKDRGYRIGYASSQDLVHWTRDDSKAGLTVSSDGWDSEMVSYPHVFELDGRWFMLYLGNQVGRFGFGLASLET